MNIRGDGDATVIAVDKMEEYRAVRDIIAKTNKEKPKAVDVAQLRKMLAENPNLWRAAGDFSEQAVFKIINDTSTSHLVRESTRIGVEKMKESLDYEDSSPLEKMLINQVALCWLRLNILERVHWTKTYESHTTEAGLYWDRRLSTAQRRFTRACETLAKVRKLTRATRPKAIDVTPEAIAGVALRAVAS